MLHLQRPLFQLVFKFFVIIAKEFKTLRMIFNGMILKLVFLLGFKGTFWTGQEPKLLDIVDRPWITRAHLITVVVIVQFCF